MSTFWKYKQKQTIEALISKRDDSFRRYEDAKKKSYEKVATFYYNRYIHYCETINKLKDTIYA